MNCSIHNKEFKEYTNKNGVKYMGHWDAASNGMCFPPKGATFANSTSAVAKTESEPVREPIVEEKVDWDAKDRQSMAQTAMKSASEIVAAMLNVGIVDNSTSPQGLVKEMANDFFKELRKLKAEV